MGFHVGQRVVCIETPKPRADRPGYGDELFPVKGGVYTVRDVLPFSNIPAIRVFEIRNLVRRYARHGAIEPLFPARYFRPVIERDTSIEIFTRMLTPSPKQTEKV